MIIEKYRVNLDNGYEEFPTMESALEKHPDSTPEFVQEDQTEQLALKQAEDDKREKSKKRKEALEAEWSEPFSLLDDLIIDLKAAGFGDFPTIIKRDDIKAANPK